MIRLFLPTDGPSWLRRFAESVADAFRTIMPAPFRLWDVATADLPAAADHKQGLVFDLTKGTFLLSNGSDWLEYARLSGAAFGGRIDSPTVRATGEALSGSSGPGVEVLVTGGAGYVQSYDRTAASYFSLGLAGNVVNLWAGSTLVAQAHSAGFNVNSALTLAGDGSDVAVYFNTGSTITRLYDLSVGGTTYFDLAFGGAAHGAMVWRSSNAASELMRLDSTGLAVSGPVTTTGASAGVSFAERDGGDSFVAYMQSDALRLYSAGADRMSLTKDGTLAVGDATHFGNDHVFYGTITILTDAGESLRVSRYDGSSGQLTLGSGLASISATQQTLTKSLSIGCEEQKFSCNLTTCLTLTADRASLGVPVRLYYRSTFTLPTPSADLRGAMVYVTNESGGEVPAFCDGTNWRRVTDRSVVS